MLLRQQGAYSGRKLMIATFFRLSPGLFRQDVGVWSVIGHGWQCDEIRAAQGRPTDFLDPSSVPPPPPPAPPLFVFSLAQEGVIAGILSSLSPRGAVANDTTDVTGQSARVFLSVHTHELGTFPFARRGVEADASGILPATANIIWQSQCSDSVFFSLWCCVTYILCTGDLHDILLSFSCMLAGRGVFITMAPFSKAASLVDVLVPSVRPARLPSVGSVLRESCQLPS